VTLNGHRYVVKYLDSSRDWTMRAAAVPGGVPLELWSRGVLQRIPECFEQPIIAVATGHRDDPVMAHLKASASRSAPSAGGEHGPVTALLMRDVGAWLLPVSDEPVRLEDHLRILEHMAALHAQFWQVGPEIDIVSPLTPADPVSGNGLSISLPAGQWHPTCWTRRRCRRPGSRR